MSITRAMKDKRVSALGRPSRRSQRITLTIAITAQAELRNNSMLIPDSISGLGRFERDRAFRKATDAILRVDNLNYAVCCCGWRPSPPQEQAHADAKVSPEIARPRTIDLSGTEQLCLSEFAEVSY